MFDEDKFWRRGIRQGECLIWKGGRSSNGYGRITINRYTDYVHRVAFRLHYGRDAKHLVRHTCHNKLCYEPKHLIEGMPKDNARDSREAYIKSRPPRICSPMARLLCSMFGRTKAAKMLGIPYGSLHTAMKGPSLLRKSELDYYIIPRIKDEPDIFEASGFDEEY